MPGRFHWIRWSIWGSKKLPDNAVHLGTKSESVTYIGRVFVGADGQITATKTTNVLYGEVCTRGGDWFVEVAGSDGQLHEHKDFEFLLALKEGYYWVPNVVPPPHGAYLIDENCLAPSTCAENDVSNYVGILAHQRSRREKAVQYLARTYEVKDDGPGRFYCGVASLITLYYQAQGCTEQKCTGHFEILAELPLEFLMDSCRRVDEQGIIKMVSTVSAGGQGNRINFGWIRHTHVNAVNKKFLVPVGTESDRVVYVCREVAKLSTQFRGVSNPFERLERPYEILLARPGSYMWVQNDIACHLYESDSSSPEFSMQVHDQDDGPIFLDAWHRRFRKSRDANNEKCNEWDYWICRFPCGSGYKPSPGFSNVSQRCRHSVFTRGKYDCLVFLHRQMVQDSPDSIRTSPEGTEKPREHLLVPSGVIGWIPVNNAAHLSSLHELLSAEEMNGALINELSLRKNIIIRKNGKRGHLIEVVDSFEVLLSKFKEGMEVLWGSPGSCVWVADRAGFVPNPAIDGGDTENGERIYIGRVGPQRMSENENQAQAARDHWIGEIRPFSRGLVAPETSVVPKDTTVYVVLCAAVNAPKQPANVGQEGDMFQSSQNDEDHTSAFLLNELRRLQRTKLHQGGNESWETGGLKSYNERMEKLFLPLDVDTLFKTSDWIPYVSRLARVCGLPVSTWPLFFRYIVLPYGGDDKPRLKSRVACIMKHAVEAAGGSFCREDIYVFIPYLQHMASEFNQSESTTEDALEAFLVFLTSYQRKYSLDDDLMCRVLRSKDWIAAVERCVQKLQPERRTEWASRFEAVGMQGLRLPKNESAPQSTVLAEKLKKTKRKSLISSAATPIANTVVTEHLKAYYNAIWAVKSEVGPIRTKKIFDLYRQYNTIGSFATKCVAKDAGTTKCDGSTEDVGTAGRSTGGFSYRCDLLADIIQHRSQESVSALCQSLSNPISPPLTTAELRTLMECVTQELIKRSMNNATIRESMWAIALSLEKQTQKPSDTEVRAFLVRIVPILTKSVKCSVTSLLVEAFWTLILTLTEVGEFPITCSVYRQFESMLTEIQTSGTKIATQLTLSILCQNPNLTKSAPSTNAAIIGLLAVSQEKVTRILAARYLALVTSNHGQRLRQKQLKFLATLTGDISRDVRIHSRVAFANGFLNNKNRSQFQSVMRACFHTMFATQPVILSASGGPAATEEFTYRINGPLLKILNGAKPVSKDAWHSVSTFVINRSKSATEESAETRKVLKEALKLFQKRDSLYMPQTVAFEKLFLKTAYEDRDEELAVECLACLIKCTENEERQKKEDFKGSGRLLQTLTARMMSKSNPIYLQCLHALTSIQELPADVFSCYHREMAHLRMYPEPLPEDRIFMVYQDLDVPWSCGSLPQLAKLIKSRFQSHLLVSTRTTRAFLDACSTRQLIHADILSCLEGVADAAYFFREDEIQFLFTATPFQRAFPLCKKTWIKIIENQGLPLHILQYIMNAVTDNIYLKAGSVDLVHRIVTTQEYLPPSIVSYAVDIGLNAMRTAHQDQNIGQEGRKLVMRIAVTYELEFCKVERVIGTALERCSQVNTVNGHESTSNLELLLKLKLRYPAMVSWGNLHDSAAMEGLPIWRSNSYNYLRKVWKLMQSPILQACIGPENFHIFFQLLFLQFGEDPVAALCEYLLDGTGSHEFRLQLDYMHRFRLILQQCSEACQSVLDALTRTRRTCWHLRDLGNCIFIAWSRSANVQVEKACEEMIRFLVAKKGWKLESEELRQDLELLVRIEGKAGLGIPIGALLSGYGHKPFSAQRAGSDGRSAVQLGSIFRNYNTQKKSVVTRRQFVDEIIRTGFSDLLVTDLETKVLLRLLLEDVYDLLDRAGNVELMNCLKDETTLSSRVARGRGGLSFFHSIWLFIRYLPISEVKGATERLPVDAQVFALGLDLHNKFPAESRERTSKRGSFILASRIISLSESTDPYWRGVYFSIERIPRFQSHDEIASFIEVVSVMTTMQEYVLVSPEQLDHIIQEELGHTNSECMDSHVLYHYFKTGNKLGRLLPQVLLGGKPFPPVNLSSICNIECSLPETYPDNSLQLRLHIEFKTTRSQLIPKHRDLMLCFPKKIKKGRKGLDDIVRDFLELNKHAKLTGAFSEVSTLLHILEKILLGNHLSTYNDMANISSIPKWSKENIKQWAATHTIGYFPSDSLVIEYFLVAQRAVQLLKGWKLTTIQILTACLAVLNQPGKEIQGQFFQVSTGSGKSAIIAVIAAAKAFLYNLRVDVHTHNPLLAKRDAEEWSEFYECFNIKCSHNMEENFCDAKGYRKGEKGCYKGPDSPLVVYGDTRQFQFDTLRSEYLSLNTRAGRPYECAILDEVDSMYIDDAEKLTILSSPISGMDLLQPLYHYIWQELCTMNESTNLIQIQQSYFTYDGSFERDEISGLNVYIHGDSLVTETELFDLVSSSLLDSVVAKDQLRSLGLRDRRAFIKTNLIGCISKLVGQNKCSSGHDDGHRSDSIEHSKYPFIISIPNNLREFVECQIGNWAESALKAVAFEEDRDYVIIDGQAIAPLDPNNGTTMEVSSWSNGLQQFLQIKHSLRFSPESLPVAYLSNKAMISKYKAGEIFGFSGTLKGAEQFFHGACGIQIVQIPDLHHNNFYLYPVISTKTKAGWKNEVIASVDQQTERHRAVLVICQTIHAARTFKQLITERTVSKGNAKQQRMRILLHVRSDKFEGKAEALDDWRSHPGDVIITTLLGARGMDIKTGDVERFGGLHVIITFLLPNTRLEAQAFGRTARQGNYGSAQYILKIPHEYQCQDIFQIFSQRELREQSYLDFLEKNIYPIISSNDQAFKSYAKTFNSIYHSLLQRNVRTRNNVRLYGYKFSEFEWTLLDTCQECWALQRVTASSHLVSTSITRANNDGKGRTDTHAQLLTELMKCLKRKSAANVYTNLKRDIRGLLPVFQLTKSCFLPTRLAFYLFYRQTQFKSIWQGGGMAAAFKLFQLAIQIDEDHAVGARYGLACIRLRGRRILGFPAHTKGYKSKAIGHLETALDIVTSQLARWHLLTASTCMLEARTQRGHQSPYEIQLDERLQVLNRYSEVLVNTLDMVKDTLRPVHITALTKGACEAEAHVFGKAAQFPPSENSATPCILSCHGLKWTGNSTLCSHEVQLGLTEILKRDKDLLPQVKVTLVLSGSNASSFMSILKSITKQDLFKKHILKTFDETGFMMGGICEDLTLVKRIEDLKAVETSLAKAKEVFLRIPASRTMRSLEFFRYKEIDVDAITFQSLTTEEATAVLKALPQGTTVAVSCRGLRWQKDLGYDHEVKASVSAVLGIRGEKGEPEVLTTLSLIDQDAANFKSLLMYKPEVVEKECKQFCKYDMKLGGDPHSLTAVTDRKELENVTHQLCTAKELFAQLAAPGLIKLLEFLRSHKINDDGITFHGLTCEEASSILGTVPRKKDPIRMLSIKPFAASYGAHCHRLDILRQLHLRGLGWVASFSETRTLRHRSHMLLVTLFAVEASVAWGCLSMGAALPLGSVFTAAALKDLHAVVASYRNRSFSWKSFGLAKVVGLVVSGILKINLIISSFESPQRHTAKQILSYKRTTTENVYKYTFNMLKGILSYLVGPLLEYLYDERRHGLVAEVQKTVTQFVKRPRMKQLLTTFIAIKGLECDESSFSTPGSLTYVFQIWAKCIVDLDLDKLKESKGVSVAEEARRLVQRIGIKVRSVFPVKIIYNAYKLIRNVVDVQKATTNTCEMLEEQLEKYARRFDLIYILTTFCDLTKEQVMEELNIREPMYPPFSADVLPQSNIGTGTITDEQLSHARATLKKFNVGNDESNVESTELLYSISTFIANHIVGASSSAIVDAWYKSVIPHGAVVTMENPSVSSDPIEQPAVFRILAKKQPEKSNRQSVTSSHYQLENNDYSVPTKLLAAWVKESKNVQQGDTVEIDHALISPAAKFLAQVLLLCCLEGRNVRLLEVVQTVDQRGNDSNQLDPGSFRIEYQLDEGRSKIVALTVKNEVANDEWHVQDGTGNTCPWGLLSNLCFPEIAVSLQQYSSAFPTQLQRIEKIFQELISQHV